jgi:hypothetical protein
MRSPRLGKRPNAFTTSPPMVSNSSSGKSLPKWSLNSSTVVRAFAVYSRALRLKMGGPSSKSCSGRVTVFVHHDGHVITAGAKLPEQHVQALAFGYEHCRAQEVADVEAAPFPIVGAKRQHILGEQYADDLPLVVTDNGETGMGRLHGDLEYFLQRIIAADTDHIRPGNHDVAYPQVGDLQHALHHAQGFRVEQGAAPGILQQLYELLLVLRFAARQLAELLQPSPCARSESRSNACHLVLLIPIRCGES